MSQWKGPFEELYYKALSDGAQDIAMQTETILRDAGISEEKILELSASFQAAATIVHQRHAYTRGTLSTLPRVPHDRMQDSTSFEAFIPG